MHVTWLDNNSWLLEMADTRILLDPWLVGDLVFGNAPWFFKATHPHPIPIPGDISFILLSQGLPDHAHPQTLKALDHAIPVIGSPNAAKVARSIGFESVTALAHDETFIWNQRLKIQAFPGSLVGPQLVENAFVLEDLQSHTSLYYEPHGNHSSRVRSVAPVDVVIAPLVNKNLPLVGPFIRGGEPALELMEWLQPQVILPTLGDGKTESEGILDRFISESGSVEEFRERLSQVLPKAQVLVPHPQERIELALQTKASTL